MLFSIIIPVYNRAEVVKRTLKSVLAQTYRPLQVVLVDNNSTDESLDVLQKFALEHDTTDFQVIVVGERHHTAGAARNRGAEHATGDWLLFFDSDDEMSPSLVSDYAAMVCRHKGELDLISTTSRLMFPDGTSRNAPFFLRDILANHILHGQLATQRYAVRRDFFMTTGRWNIDLPGWNDWELGIRLLLASPHMAFMGGEPRVIIYHNGTDSITGTEFHSRAGQWELVIDIAKDEVWRASPHGADRYIKLLEYRRLVLAAHYEREGCPDLANTRAQTAYDALRDSYGNSRRWRWWVAPVAQLLYRRIVAGKRGSARIARRLF